MKRGVEGYRLNPSIQDLFYIHYDDTQIKIFNLSVIELPEKHWVRTKRSASRLWVGE